jgi:hypothetical protein
VKKILPVLSALFVLVFTACEPPETVKSTWAAADSLLTSDPVRWKQFLQYPDDPQFGIGVKNDGKYLYLCMTSWKREVNKRILAYGLTTWFSSKSKKGKRFGIRFPMGEPGNPAGFGGRRHHGGLPGSGFARENAQTFQEMELLGPGKNDSVPVKTMVAESFGIVARAFPADEYFVYLLAVPFNSDSICRYAMDIGKDSLINVTFESIVPESLIDREREGGPTSSPPVAAGGLGSGSSGMGGGPPGRPSGVEYIDPFSAGFTIGIARKPVQ